MGDKYEKFLRMIERVMDNRGVPNAW